MHVEFRLSEIAHTCAFDPESFFRAKQVAAALESSTYSSKQSVEGNNSGNTLTNPPIGGAANIKFLNFSSSVNGSGGKQSSSAAGAKGKTIHVPSNLLSSAWAPKLRVQFVLEGLVKMDSSDLQTTADRTQHEKLSSNWEGSPIRTKRFSVRPNEVILAALPVSVADCVVKIRLLQLPPSLGSAAAERAVEHAVNAKAPVTGKRTDAVPGEPICIGVSKITLRELMEVRGGVCMALQPKTTYVRAVEELNLNTVATNSMFGKDVGGSSFFTFQVISYSFGKVRPSRLLLFKEKSRPKARQHTDSDSISVNDALSDYGGSNDPGSVSREASFQDLPGRIGPFDRTAPRISSPPPRPIGSAASDTMTHSERDSYGQRRQNDFGRQEIAVGRFDTAAIRFVFIPYLTVIDLLLQMHDLAAWRRPKKTVILILIVLLVMASDSVDIAFFLAWFFQIVWSVRTMTKFYRVPVTESGAGPMTAGMGPHATEDSYVYLYGRQNILLNAFVRARFFFTQGLQEDSYFELALILHTIRRRQRKIVLSAAVICLSICALSFETLFMCGLVSTFVLYPVAVRIPNLRPGGKKKKTRTMPTLHGMLKSWMLGAPMHISRVVQVALRAPAAERPSMGTVGPSLSMDILDAPLALDTPNGGMKSDFSAPVRGNAFSSSVSSALQQRARTFDIDAVFSSPALGRQQSQHVAGLSFAVINFNCDSLSSGGSASRPCEALVLRLRQHLETVRRLHAADAFSAPPSAGTNGSNRRASAVLGGPSTTRNMNNSNKNNTGDTSARGTADTPTVNPRSVSMSFRTPVQQSTQQFFNDTVSLLSYIMNACTLQAFVSPAAELGAPLGMESPSRSSEGTVSLNFFVRQQWLLEHGEDDGVTSALYGLSKNTFTVKKLVRTSIAENDARALALLSCYFLQGFRLSLYSAGPASHTCSMIIPLEMYSNRFRSMSPPNPCPPHLAQALEEIWRGNFDGNSASSPIKISKAMVMQIIKAYKDDKAGTLARADSLAQPEDGGALQRQDSARHQAPRSNFLTTLTAPFGLGSAARQQSMGGRQISGSAMRTPMLTAGPSGTSYGVLGANRDAAASQEARARENRASGPLIGGGIGSGGTARRGTPVSGGAASTPRVTQSTPKAGVAVTQREKKDVKPPKSDSDDSSLTPPDLTQTHRGGRILELESNSSMSVNGGNSSPVIGQTD